MTSAPRSPDEQALEVLGAALANSGAQDATCTSRETARTRADELARRAAERAATAALLTQRQTEREQLRSQQQQHRDGWSAARLELGGTSRWRGHRRRELTKTIVGHQEALDRVQPAAIRLDTEIRKLSVQVGRDTRQRQDEQRTSDLRPKRTEPEPRLSPAMPVGPPGVATTRNPAAADRQIAARRRAAELNRRRTVDHTRAPERRTPGIGS